MYFLGLFRGSNFSRSEPTVTSETDVESDYVTGLEDFPSEKTKVKKRRLRRKLFKGLNNPCQTSSFIQNILSEDSKTGVAVVDLFVAVKTVKDNLDFLVRKNDDVIHQINALNVESGVVRNEYRNLAEDMRSFLNELNGLVHLYTFPKARRRAFSFPLAMARNRKRSLTTTRAKRCSGTSGSWSKRYAASRVSSVTFLDSACARRGPRNYVSADETINERLLQNSQYNSDQCDEAQEKSVCYQIEGSCPKCSKNAISFLDYIASTLKSPKKDRPRVSKTLLGSFLASVLWLKKRETSLSKPLPANDKEDKPSISESTVRMICDLCEVFGGFTDSTSEDDERFSEAEDQSSHSPKMCKASKSVESNESDSAFDEAYSTPPPSPPPSFFELKSKPSVTCMGDLTKEEKKKNVSTVTDGSTASVAVVLAEEIKSTVKYLKSKKKAIRSDQVMKSADKEIKKFPEAVEFTIAATTASSAFDVTARKHEDPKSYSSDSLDNLIDFDSDDLAASSLSGEDEMEEFRDTSVPMILSRPRTNDPPMMATFKTAKPTFFEMWKCYPKLFMQEVLSRSAKIKTGENREVKEQNNPAANQVVALLPGEKQEQEIVIENSSLDLVIYIQVEVEENDKKEQLIVDFETNSFGTQTSNHMNESPILEEKANSEEHVYDIWRKQESDEMEEYVDTVSVTSNKISKVCEIEKMAKTVVFADEVSEIFMKEKTPSEILMKEKTPSEILMKEKTPSEILMKEKTNSEILMKEKTPSEILMKEKTPSETKKTENAVAVALVLKEGILTANVYFQQQELHSACLIERPTPFYRLERNVELERALELIHEIENDVVETKLSDALLILPRLESELRKHFKHKVKSLVEFDKSLDTFFSAFDIWPVEGTNEPEREDSGERLCNLLTLLSDLEKAVKASERSIKVKLCGYDSSKIYGLLHALTESIRELEDCSNVTSLSQTLDIASQVDTAVREFESILRRTPTEYVASVQKNRRTMKSQTSGEISPKQYLKNVRKRVFEMVEEEAIDTEARLEKDLDKLERLERQNDEAMKFVEAFLQKTQRRAAELATTKTEYKELSTALDYMYEELVKARQSKNKTPEEESVVETELATSSLDLTLEEATEPVKETVSGLLLALDNLKSRARQKNELCREILSNVSFEKEIKEQDTLTRSSRSSFTAKNVESLYSWVKDFKKIGDHSLYLSWTKPKGPLADSLVGYEIFVNGKLNQKVRNPQRLQAILYSIDLNRMAEVLLYGLMENGFRIFLATVTYAAS